jgi:hypothetical protein
MIRIILITTISLGIAASATPQQQSVLGPDAAVAIQAQQQQAQDGKVTSVNADKDEIKVKVGEREYTSNKKTKLLNAQGKEAKISDFAVDDKVKVTLTGDTVTTLQKEK